MCSMPCNPTTQPPPAARVWCFALYLETRALENKVKTKGKETNRRRCSVYHQEVEMGASNQEGRVSAIVVARISGANTAPAGNISLEISLLPLVLRAPNACEDDNTKEVCIKDRLTQRFPRLAPSHREYGNTRARGGTTSAFQFAHSTSS